MNPEGLIMLVPIIIGLGGLALYLRVKIYLMDRRKNLSRPPANGRADGSRDN